MDVGDDLPARSGQPPKWLVTGGAGYIGAHVVRALLGRGFNVSVLDNLESGIPERLPTGVRVHVGHVGEVSSLLGDTGDEAFVGVVHLAGLKNARESAAEPLRYWSYNVAELVPLLTWATDCGISNFVFSSSSSLYGNQAGASEGSDLLPLSPYGNSKAAGERFLADVANAHGINVCCLRYFNVVGCDSFPHAHDTGSDNVVPRFVAAARSGSPMQIYGAGHDTPDGTCVRDYVDVRDLAVAHALAASQLLGHQEVPRAINVSTGVPVSVGEIAVDVARACGLQETLLDVQDAHPADPAEVWAHPSPILQTWGWKPRYSVVESINAHVTSVAAQVVDARD